MNPIQTSLSGIKPVGQDRHGLQFSKKDVRKACVNDINDGNYFERRAKEFMSKDLDNAASICDEATKMFDKSFSHMLAAETKISDAAKKTSGNVRKAANELAEGLAKIEKTANFDRLERYVSLLERAASAMQSLSALQDAGKLEKIAGALK